MRHLVHSNPQEAPTLLTQPVSRWTLEGIRAAVPWLAATSLSGVWRLLDSLDIHWKRGRDHVHSPDPHYQAKLAYLASVQEQTAQAPGRLVLLYQDELTYYRQPTLASGYAGAGERGPLAERSHRGNTRTRVAAALDASQGEVTCVQASRVGVSELVRLYDQLGQRYHSADRLYLVQDNWPVHFHPDVLAALEPQEFPWPWPCPASWTSLPRPQGRTPRLSIQLVALPTYASWCNPIEKLWRWLKQDVLHLHPWADDLPELRRQVLAFLERFRDGSADLLRYVGLRFPH